MGNTFRTGKLMNGLYVDDNGRVGIGTTSILSWYSNNYTSLQIGGMAGLFSNTTTTSVTGAVSLTYNLYVDSAGSYQYINTTNARAGSVFSLEGGNLTFSTAPSATSANPTVSERFRITSDGKVGIGTTSPGVKFVNSGAAVSDTPTLGSGAIGASAILSANGLYGLYTGVTINGHIWNQVQRNDGNTSVYNYILQPLGGNVGIGTSSPAAIISGSETTLNVKGSTTGAVGSIVARSNGYSNSTSIGIAAFDSVNLTGIYVETNSPMAFWTNSTERMRITSGGNVGINTTNPIYKFQTYNTSNEWGTLLQSNAGTEQVNTYISHGGGYGLAIDSTANSDGIYLFKLNGGNGGSGQGAIEHLKVLSNGSLLMGTGGTRSYIRMGRFSNSMNNGGEAWIGRASDRPTGVMTVQLGGSTNTNFEVVDRAWSVVVFSVQGNGNYSFAGSNVSDRRKKENISYIATPQLDNLLKLKPATFNKITGIGVSQNTHTGFIAQDILEDGIPNLVHGDEEQGYGLDYDGILALAVKAIQELKAEIEILKNK